MNWGEEREPQDELGRGKGASGRFGKRIGSLEAKWVGRRKGASGRIERGRSALGRIGKRKGSFRTTWEEE